MNAADRERGEFRRAAESGENTMERRTFLVRAGQSMVCTLAGPATKSRLRTQQNQSLGATWGSSDPVRGHVVRWPTTLRWRWNATTAPAVHSQALIVSGMLDKLTPPVWATELCESLSSTEKVLVRIDCGSHATFLEGSTNPSGWGGPHVVAQDASLQWLTKGTYNGATKGIFHARTDNTTGIDPK